MENDQREERTTPQSLVTEENVKITLLADKGEDAQLLSWEVIDFMKAGDNYACVVSSVLVKYSLNGKELEVSYVVKLNPCRGFKDFERFLVSMFSKEANFYLKLLPELNSVLQDAGIETLRVPRCINAFLEAGKEQIYFEDLRTRGFKMFDKRKGMDFEHAILVFKELGRLHASSLLYEKKIQDKAEITHDYLVRDFITPGEDNEIMMGLLENYITTGVEMLKKVGGYERAIHWAESLKPQVGEMFTTALKTEGFNVVNHGDCWNNNMLFRYNDEGHPEEVMLLDLQICRKSSLAIDLNYFLFTSFHGDVRTKNLSHFLDVYYETFRSAMSSGGLDLNFTKCDLLKEFRAKNHIGGFFGMMVVPLILMEPEDVPDMTGSTDEDVSRLIGEFRAKAMEMMDENPLLKPRYLAIFDELIETGLIQ